MLSHELLLVRNKTTFISVTDAADSDCRIIESLFVFLLIIFIVLFLLYDAYHVCCRSSDWSGPFTTADGAVTYTVSK